MIKTLFLSIMQVLYLSSTIIGFGLFLDYVSKKANALIYAATGWAGVVATGFIGTPVHEFGHLVFAVLFGHKIEDVKLLPIKNENGVFGYVSHSYNPANLYQVIGNFFIGIAPMFSGTIALMILMKILLPQSYEEFRISMNTIMTGSPEVNSVGKFIMAIKSSFKALLSIENLTSVRFYVYIIIGVGIASHMSLSLSDIKNSLIGFVFVCLVFFAINVILAAIGKETDFIVQKLTSVNFYLSIFFAISTVFSLLFLAFAYIIFRVSR